MSWGLAAAVEAAVDRGTGMGIGDLAVLVPTNALVERHTELIGSLGPPTQPLSEYDGTPNSFTKVGTYQRAKGLEFGVQGGVPAPAGRRPLWEARPGSTVGLGPQHSVNDRREVGQALADLVPVVST